MDHDAHRRRVFAGRPPVFFDRRRDAPRKTSGAARQTQASSLAALAAAGWPDWLRRMRFADVNWLGSSAVRALQHQGIITFGDLVTQVIWHPSKWQSLGEQDYQELYRFLEIWTSGLTAPSDWLGSAVQEPPARGPGPEPDRAVQPSIKHPNPMRRSFGASLPIRWEASDLERLAIWQLPALPPGAPSLLASLGAKSVRDVLLLSPQDLVEAGASTATVQGIRGCLVDLLLFGHRTIAPDTWPPSRGPSTPPPALPPPGASAMTGDAARSLRELFAIDWPPEVEATLVTETDLSLPVVEWLHHNGASSLADALALHFTPGESNLGTPTVAVRAIYRTLWRCLRLALPGLRREQSRRRLELAAAAASTAPLPLSPDSGAARLLRSAGLTSQQAVCRVTYEDILLVPGADPTDLHDIQRALAVSGRRLPGWSSGPSLLHDRRLGADLDTTAWGDAVHGASTDHLRLGFRERQLLRTLGVSTIGQAIELPEAEVLCVRGADLQLVDRLRQSLLDLDPVRLAAGSDAVAAVHGSLVRDWIADWEARLQGRSRQVLSVSVDWDEGALLNERKVARLIGVTPQRVSQCMARIRLAVAHHGIAHELARTLLLALRHFGGVASLDELTATLSHQYGGIQTEWGVAVALLVDALPWLCAVRPGTNVYTLAGAARDYWAVVRQPTVSAAALGVTPQFRQACLRHLPSQRPPRGAGRA